MEAIRFSLAKPTIRLHSLFAATRSKFQMVDKPTRGNNIFRLVSISDPSCTDKLQVEESFALSDHRRQFA